MKLRDYRSPGPVAEAFKADKVSFVRGIMGPQGSGKTNAVIADLIENAALMPTCLDGVKRYRHLVVRDTYINMQKSFLASWFEWFGKDDHNFSGGGDRPAVHALKFDLGGTLLEFEIHFAAIGDNRVEDVLRGFEMTAATMNEADLMAEDVLAYLGGRVGRFPPMRQLIAPESYDALEARLGRPPELEDLPPSSRYRKYITLDFNAPDVDNWTYKTFVEDRPANVAFYRQPSGFSPKAENKRNLSPRYYEDQAELNKSRPWWIRRMIRNEFGFSRDGQPVYETFNDDLHVASEPLQPRKGVPLRIGLDAGLQRPAAVFGQWLPSGQWLILGELVPGRMGAGRFAALVLKWLAEHAAGLELTAPTVDPSAFAGADKEDGELAWAETVAAAIKLPILPAPSNELDLRIESVEDQLTHMIDGHTPALMLSPTCRLLRKGFASHYRYRKTKIGNIETLSEKPEKNDFSHPHDALQYLILGAKGRQAVIEGHVKPEQSAAFKGGNTVIGGGESFDIYGVR